MKAVIAGSARLLRRAWMRLLTGVTLLTIVLWSSVMLPTVPARAAESCAVTSCVLACNPTNNRCARYPVSRVPRGYEVEENAPPGFKIVRSRTVCDSRLCRGRTASICSMLPIGP